MFLIIYFTLLSTICSVATVLHDHKTKGRPERTCKMLFVPTNDHTQLEKVKPNQRSLVYPTHRSSQLESRSVSNIFPEIKHKNSHFSVLLNCVFIHGASIGPGKYDCMRPHYSFSLTVFVFCKDSIASSNDFCRYENKERSNIKCRSSFIFSI